MRTLRHPLVRDRHGAAAVSNRLALALAAVAAATWGHAAELSDRQWALSPYRVEVVLAVEDAGREPAGFEARLAASLRDRFDAALAPLWQLNLTVAKQPTVRRQCFDLESLAPASAGKLLADADKVLLIAVVAAPAGDHVMCREYDAAVRRWSAVRTQRIAQRSSLAESIVQLAAETLSSLARIEFKPEDPTQVSLRTRGSDLPRQVGERPQFGEGRALLPLVVRLDPRGRRVDEPALPLPWTYLVVKDETRRTPTAEIISGMRNPFASRRRGTTELLAIALPSERASVPIRLHARRDATQPLAGFEVFRARGEGEEPESLGRTDADGRLTVPPGPTLVSTLFVRSDGQVLAKAPVAAGVAATLQIPLADDMVRVRAQASVRAIREELVDLVARRAILMAQVKGALKRGDQDQAREHMEALANLPIASSFAREIDAAESRAGKSPDPAVDAAIRRHFADVRTLLGKFLDSRPITELQFQVNTADARPAEDAPVDDSPTPDDAKAAS